MRWIESQWFLKIIFWLIGYFWIGALLLYAGLGYRKRSLWIFVSNLVALFFSFAALYFVENSINGSVKSHDLRGFWEWWSFFKRYYQLPLWTFIGLQLVGIALLLLRRTQFPRERKSTVFISLPSLGFVCFLAWAFIFFPPLKSTKRIIHDTLFGSLLNENIDCGGGGAIYWDGLCGGGMSIQPNYCAHTGFEKWLEWRKWKVSQEFIDVLYEAAKSKRAVDLEDVETLIIYSMIYPHPQGGADDLVRFISSDVSPEFALIATKNLPYSACDDVCREKIEGLLNAKKRFPYRKDLLAAYEILMLEYATRKEIPEGKEKQEELETRLNYLKKATLNGTNPKAIERASLHLLFGAVDNRANKGDIFKRLLLGLLSDPQTRVAAYRILGQEVCPYLIKSELYAEIFKNAQDDPDPEVRQIAQEAWNHFDLINKDKEK